jgi:hypothetical protein
MEMAEQDKIDASFLAGEIEKWAKCLVALIIFLPLLCAWRLAWQWIDEALL